MAKASKHPDQVDLFDTRDAFPVRAPSELLRARHFNRRMATAMGQAIKECGKPREAIAEGRMEAFRRDFRTAQRTG